MRHTFAVRPRAALIVVLMTIAPALPSPAQDQDPRPLDGTTPDPALVAALVEAHNKERARENLPPLKAARLLEDAAIAHAADMAGHARMSHDGSDGSTPTQRIVRAGYHYQVAGENVAHGYDEVDKVVQVWMDSPPHRKNILGDFTEIGVARVRTKDGHPYWCVDFAKPFPKLDPATAATEVIKALNAERAAAGKPALAADPRLGRAAEGEAARLSKAKELAPSQFSDLDLDQKKYRELAMNVANGHADAPALVKNLLADPAQKAQILEKFTKVGVGYAANAEGAPYWCIILAIPAR